MDSKEIIFRLLIMLASLPILFFITLLMTFIVSYLYDFLLILIDFIWRVIDFIKDKIKETWHKIKERIGMEDEDCEENNIYKV